MRHRPDRVVVVTGTGTEVGKTWWSAALARSWRAIGVRVAARKPVQSFAPGDDTAGLTDAQVLAAVTDVDPETVCPLHRWLATPMAPPMAAAALALASFTIRDLADELDWPDERAAIGLVEGAGGLRSPLADDGDTLDLIHAVAPDDVLVVADASLGAIHQVRSAVAQLGRHRVTVALNRFDPASDLHGANLDWLRDRDGLTVVTSPDALVADWA